MAAECTVGLMLPRVYRRLLILATVAWTASLFLAAYIAASPNSHSASYALALAVYSFGSFICHQRPERSFHVWTAQLPVCARCTGIYLGAAVAALAARESHHGLRASLGAWSVRPGPTAVLVAAAANAVTLVYETFTGVTPSNWIRAAAGLLLGAVVMAVLLIQLSEKGFEVNFRRARHRN